MTAIRSRNAEHFLATLLRLRRPFAYAAFAVCALFAVAGVLLGSRENAQSSLGYGIDWDYWPEAAACGAIAIVFLGAGLWLLLATESEARLTRARVLVLALGGLSGLIVALASVARALRWWSVLFTGGIEAWQGPEGWRLWTCILEGLFGLGVMFASLLLARSEERSNPVLRRLLYGYNAALSALLLLGILIVTNILFYAYFPATYTWTQTRGLTELSPKSKNILRSLKKDVQVYLIMAQGARIYPMVRTMLENCQTITDRLKVKAIPPDLSSKELLDLMDRFPSLLFSRMSRGGVTVPTFERGILLVQGSQETAAQPTFAFIPESKLYEGKGSRGGPPQTLVFKGEDAFFSELSFLMEDQKKPRIYFTQDNGEPDFARDMNALRSQLERNKFSVVGLRLRKPSETMKSSEQTKVAIDVPADAQVVVAVNPVEPFSKTALDALRRYMAKNGKLLALIDFDRRDRRGIAIPKTGLEKILADFNVEVEPGFLLRDNREDQDDPRLIPALPAESSTNRIALAMPRKVIPLPLARPIRSLGRAKNYGVEPILEVPVGRVTYWLETDLRAVRNPGGALSKKVIGRVKPMETSALVAVGVKDTRTNKPRLVVCGNMDMATDVLLLRDPRCYDFLESSLEWLRERGEMLGIKSVESDRYTLNAEDINLARMEYLPLWLMLTAIVGLGTGIWVVRRR